jgi:hypothetical protein
MVDLDGSAAAVPAAAPAPGCGQRWFGQTALLAQVSTVQRGTLVVEDKRPSAGVLPDGRWVAGQAF